MIKLILSIFLLSAIPALCDEEPVIQHGKKEISNRTKRMAHRFELDVEKGQLSQRMDTALDAIIRLAAYKLKRDGKKELAEQLIYEWEGQYIGYFTNRRDRDLGDHKPISMWLAEKYAILEFVLGVDVCHALRLDDIKILNFAIPMVLKCLDSVDEVEFGLHFVPLMGTVSFWCSFIVCTGGTWGSGFLFCSPIAMGVEYLVESFVAPKLNPWAWDKSCHKGEFDASMAY